MREYAGRPALKQVPDNSAPPVDPISKKWFETISQRGYVQLRSNRLLETNPNLGYEQYAASWGNV